MSEASEVWRGGREEKGNLRGNVKRKCKKCKGGNGAEDFRVISTTHTYVINKKK